MTTLPPPFIKQAPSDSLEKKVYALIDSLGDYLPISGDRNRLSFSLYKYLTGEGDEPAVSVKHNKLTITGISENELVNKIESGISEIKD